MHQKNPFKNESKKKSLHIVIPKKIFVKNVGINCLSKKRYPAYEHDKYFIDIYVKL